MRLKERSWEGGKLPRWCLCSGMHQRAGEDIPPMVIVKGLAEKSLNAYNVAEGPPGCKYTYQRRPGWKTSWASPGSRTTF